MQTAKKMAVVMLLAMVALTAINSTAYATFEMKLWDSDGNSVTVPETVPGSGQIIKIDGTLGSWTFSQNVGLGSPLVGSLSAPEMDLNFGISSGPTTSGKWLKIALSETGFTTGPAGVTLTAGGTLGGGNDVFQAYYDPTNQLYGGITGSAISALGPYTSSSFNGTNSNGSIAGGLYSLSVLGTFTSNGQSLHSGGDVGMTVTPTPIPAALWLFGPGLVGLVGLRKKLS
ncbi:MAG TPA: hypothetical protein VFG09_00195 [Thermodesulfovibrionales bacterium]|jgi:hypothetical protein|nr:hypothetical protein [Thermodesulfovibrionales bacterium]